MIRPAAAGLPLHPHEVLDGGALAQAVLALNNDHAAELSFLTPARMAQMIAQAFLARRIGTGAAVEALLIAFDQGAAYDSPNFLWFRDRFARFVYVDRVVVAPFSRGRGHAWLLYDELFEAARQGGHTRIVCEVNTAPPNPGSDAFHAALGFTEIGQASIHGGAKTVRYLERMVEGGRG